MTPAEADLGALAERMRAQIDAGLYAGAQENFERYCRALGETLGHVQPGDPLLARLEAQWQQMLAETRRRVLARRAQAAQRLAGLSRPRFFAGDPAPRRSWEILG